MLRDLTEFALIGMGKRFRVRNNFRGVSEMPQHYPDLAIRQEKSSECQLP
jgi:hypothetical protein